MHYEYHKKSGEALEDAKKSNFFSLKGMQDESILARYYLIRAFYSLYGFIPNLSKGKNGQPIPVIWEDKKHIYWSISHSENYIAFIFSEDECGIDIEEIRSRDQSVLNIHSDREYHILGEKNWENFYRLWTAKESIIKKCGTVIDNISDIRLIRKLDDGYSFEFQGKSYTIVPRTHDSLVISYTF